MSQEDEIILTVPDIIKKKRDGYELETDEINHFIKSTVNGTANDAQIGAWLMAVYLNGMTERETADLTKAMVCTGECLQFKPSWTDLLVDKHSTGGVGDKVSLILAPALACFGLKIPMISGRGLGFTGGTLDKLESIPGFQVRLSFEEMQKCLDKVGFFIADTTNTIATADKILYKLRDLTNTVSSAPLIISSILSKKAAEGIKTLIMDIKIGCGSQLKDEKEGMDMALKIINISKHLNIETCAVLSDMDAPLGRCVGNSLEVLESVECLKNKGSEDVNSLVKTLGGILLFKKGIARTVEEGEEKIEEVLANGNALNKFREMLLSQGVTDEVANNLCNEDYPNVLPKARFITKYKAEKSGVVKVINAEDIAYASWYLGAGRSGPEMLIDYSVGVKLLTLVGNEVQLGDNWVEVHHNTEIVNKYIEKLIRGSITIESPGTKFVKKARIIKTL